jgi:ABC-type multidrug transport system fused ATPase/permease subunit
MLASRNPLISAAFVNNKQRVSFSYTLAIAGGMCGHLYPLATALAIDGVLRQNYWSILWLIACHFTTVVLEVAAKLADARAFTKVYGDLATHLTAQSFSKGVDPAIVASRIALSREYITFLERDIPALLLNIVALVISICALFWFDPIIAITSLALVIPLGLISRRLARRSYSLNVRLNRRLEREVMLLKARRLTSITRHFRALAGWRVRLSDTEARAYFKMELAVIVLFAIALVRLGEGSLVEAGSIYAIFSYIWKYVLALDGVPALVQQLSKLKDLNERLVD